jgi:hypothetical protein
MLPRNAIGSRPNAKCDVVAYQRRVFEDECVHDPQILKKEICRAV